MRRLSAVAIIVLGAGCGLSGCSGEESDMETAYDHCVETFIDQVAEVNQGEDFGDAGEYLGYESEVLTVQTPGGQDPAVASIGANGAIVCVMTDLGAPADARRDAAAGAGDGSESWAGYNAEWVVSNDPFVLGLRVTSK